MPTRISRPLSGTIADEASLSSEFDIRRWINANLVIVTAWTVAAGITFQGRNDGSTLYNIYDKDGTEVLIPSHATHTGRAYELPAAVMNFDYIKVRSGTSGTPVAQTTGPYTLQIVAKT